MQTIEIFDTTCRDGEQATKGFKDPDSKLLIAKELVNLNVTAIEAGFPISSEGDFNAVKKIADNIQGPYICALARCKKEDIERAWEAIKNNNKPTIHVFTFMVDPDSLKAYGITEFNDIIEQSTKAVKYAKELMKNKGRVEFSAQNATIGNREQIYEIYEKVIEAGADVVNLPDTAGYSFPDEIYNFITDFKKNVKNSDQAIISIHCHNDLGNAVANSIAAVKAGVRQVECTINGIGERAGNASAEEVVMNIEARKQTLNLTTEINTKLFGEISKLVSDHSNTLVQPNKAIVGSNAFRHSSGIHQDGVLKGAGYEIMKPEDVGWVGNNIDLTARSGKKGFLHRLIQLGYDKDKIENFLDNIVKAGKKLSDEKGSLSDDDLKEIADKVLSIN